jgi:hypothetical protein
MGLDISTELINLKSWYYPVSIRKRDVEKTRMQIKHDLYEFV